MDDNNLEITKEIETLDILNEIESNPTASALDVENEINDINDQMDSISETIESIDKLSDDIKDVKPKKKLKDKIKEKWNSFSKKKKIIIIIITVLVILLIALGIFFAIKSLNKKDDNIKKEDVILEADNYRYENGYLILLDDEKELGKYECTNKDEDLCYVAYYEIDENIDNAKKIDEDGNILNTRSDIILKNYVFIHDGKNDSEKVNLFDIKNNKIIEEYNGVKSNKDNYVIVKDYSNSYGILEFSDDEVTTKIDFNYDNLAFLDDTDKDNIIANESGRNYLININEKIITKAISFEIVNYNSKYLVAIDDEKNYYLYDYNNKLIYDDKFEYIKLYDDYILFIKDKNVYLTDTDGNKLNEDGYAINNKYKYYQKLYIYDEDNKLDKTYEPFSVTNNTNSITLTIDEKDYVISKFEGKISAATKFINYFDGILYIYDNEDKTNLIGEYKCTNKNVLTDSSTSFENCFVASDTGSVDNDMTTTTSSGMIPIINHRYIFIKDNPNAVSESNTNIVLYDLTDKKVISKYLSVNTNLNTNESNPSYQTETNVYVIAKNKSNKYGVITINSSGISSLISFNYNSIENIGNYYLSSDGSGYSLIDKNGSEITKKISGKIRGYNANYLKVYENNAYQIYDYSGTKITSNGFKYIELYDNYFAGVDSSNKLNIYSYKEPSKALIQESVSLSSNKYYGDGQVAFKVSIASDTATISTLNDNSYLTSVYSLNQTTTSTEAGE